MVRGREKGKGEEERWRREGRKRGRRRAKGRERESEREGRGREEKIGGLSCPYCPNPAVLSHLSCFYRYILAALAFWFCQG